MKIKKLISSALVCTAAAGALPLANISAAETDWKVLYTDVLFEYMETADYSEHSRFSLYDISGDNIPELIISEDTSHAAQCHVYTICDDELVDLGKMGRYGEIGYYPDTNVIAEYNLGQGYEFIGYRRLEKGTLTTLDCFNSNPGAAAEEADLYYKVNEDYVTPEEYNAALEKYKGEDYISLGLDYKFSEQSICNAISGNYSYRELYRDKLYEFKRSEDFSEDSRFDLFDINGDDIPELFITSGTNGVGEGNYPFEAYTVSDGNLTDMGMLGYDGAYYYVLKFYPETDTLLVSSWFRDGQGGSIDYYRFMKMEDKSLVETDFIEQFWDMESQKNIYTLNGEECSYDDYCELAFASPYVYIGSKYSFGDAAIEYALREDDKLTSVHKAIYISKLFQLKAEFSHGEYDYEPIDDAQFELCDLNGDGYAELAFSPSTSYAGGTCSIFSVNKRKLLNYGNLGFYGEFRYNAESGLVYILSDRMGLTNGNFYRLNSEEWERVISYGKRDEDYVDERISMGLEDEYYYTLNGNEVTREEYYAAAEEYENEESSIWCGRRNVLTIDSISDVFFGGTSLIPKIKTVFCAIEGAGYLC